jgi:hypothetical protein
MKTEFLLSEEFVDFSANVKRLHDQKKEFEAEFKKFFTEHKARVKAIDEEALKLQQDFDNWVVSKSQPPATNTKDKS